MQVCSKRAVALQKAKGGRSGAQAPLSLSRHTRRPAPLPGEGVRVRVRMNNFLERNSSALGGPKPKGWSQTSSTTRRSPSGAPAALPSGGGLPVFEKRVQLKDRLPQVARGDPPLVRVSAIV